MAHWLLAEAVSMLALSGIACERRRALELCVGLVDATELDEQVAAHAGQEVVALERRLREPARFGRDTFRRSD